MHTPENGIYVVVVVLTVVVVVVVIVVAVVVVVAVVEVEVHPPAYDSTVPSAHSPPSVFGQNCVGQLVREMPP